MILFLITYLAGILTILSPCILPVLPFIFSRSQGSFLKSGLPLLVGMSLTFTTFSTLAVFGGEWIAQASEAGRTITLILLTLFGLSLLFPHFSDKLLSPLTRFGSKLTNQNSQTTFRGSFLMGIGTGLLWSPCAGPILGLVLTGAASQKNVATSGGLLLSYSLGAATSLAVALLASHRILNRLKRLLGWDIMIKRSLGILVLVGVAIIALHLDRTVLLGISKIETAAFEDRLLEKLKPALSLTQIAQNTNDPSAEGELPDLSGATSWLNSDPITRELAQGKVILIDFWTYSCINCLRSLPYIKMWAEKYRADGLLVIGVHTPEFAFEKNASNVKKALEELDIHYPVAVDSNYIIWNAFHNQYWPAHYFIDRRGKIRHHHFGEGNYDESEEVLKNLLTEQGETLHPKEILTVAQGAQAQARAQEIKSPETYIGYARAQGFVSPTPLLKDQSTLYLLPKNFLLNQWSLVGSWMISPERAQLQTSGGKILFRFQARDLHLVLGSDNKVRFRVQLDGKPPVGSQGVDIDQAGNGVVDSERLYQLIRQTTQEPIQDHLFEIEFLDPGVFAYAFTFG